MLADPEKEKRAKKREEMKSTLGFGGFGGGGNDRKPELEKRPGTSSSSGSTGAPVRKIPTGIGLSPRATAVLRSTDDLGSLFEKKPSSASAASTDLGGDSMVHNKSTASNRMGKATSTASGKNGNKGALGGPLSPKSADGSADGSAKASGPPPLPRYNALPGYWVGSPYPQKLLDDHANANAGAETSTEKRPVWMKLGKMAHSSLSSHHSAPHGLHKSKEHGGGSKKVALSEKDYPTRRVRSIGMLQGLISKISAPELQSQSQQYAGAHGGFVHRIEDPVLVGSEAEKEPGFWED